jgi:glycosyltransferase involved in cell wall biosynthesis
VIGSLGVGGGERVALDLASGQKRRGEEVVVVSLEEPPDGPMGAEYEAQGVRLIRKRKQPGIDVSLWPQLWRLFRGVALVHTHNPPPLLYAGPAAKAARAAWVHTKHGENSMPKKRRALLRQAARFCDAYVAVSESTAAQARADGDVDERKLLTIENGIDLSRFAPSAEQRAAVRAELELPRDAFVVGSVGRLVTEKNQARLIGAMAPLLSPAVRLILVGDGPERATVERAIAALGDKAAFVRLLGSRRDVPRLYGAFDVFALSSDSEGLPLVVIEAMASGLPVVSTAIGGIPAVVVDSVTGALVPAGDGRALAAALARLAASPTLGLSWGAEGRRRALARYSADRMVDDYFAVYERVLSQ